jgi:hypothetical protein
MQLKQIPASSTPLESRARFTLRDMFIGTAVAAAALAAVAPWFWQWDGEQRATFLSVWCSMTLGAALMSVLTCWRRIREELPAGLVRFRLPQTATSRFASFSKTALALGVAVYFLLRFAKGTYGNAHIFGTSWIPELCAFMAGMGFNIATFWIALKSTSCLELSDAGILNGVDIVPWSDVCGFRWGGNDPNLLMLQCQWHLLTFRVNPADKPAIEEFVANRLAANNRPAEHKD